MLLLGGDSRRLDIDMIVCELAFPYSSSSLTKGIAPVAAGCGQSRQVGLEEGADLIPKKIV